MAPWNEYTWFISQETFNLGSLVLLDLCSRREFFLPLEIYAIIVVPLVIPVGENTSSSYPQSLQKMIGEVSLYLQFIYQLTSFPQIQLLCTDGDT